jgi:hypothetical protein
MACSGFEKYKASHCVGIFPVALRNGSTDNFSVRLEVYDYTDKEGSSVFPNATYDINVVKNQYNTKLKDLTILTDTLNTRNGLFTVYLHTSTNSELKPSQKELGVPRLNTSTRADSINLSLPFRLQSGQYIIQSVAYVKNRQPLYFNSVLQIGDIESKNIFLNKQMNNITLISYYDKVIDFNFDINKRTISWKVPFEYNVTKIDQGKVNVHEEIIIPNTFLQLMHTNNFNMTLNDNYFDSSLFKIDPYTFENKTIIHYVPDTNTLFDISQNNGSDINNRMIKFGLYFR